MKVIIESFTQPLDAAVANKTDFTFASGTGGAVSTQLIVDAINNQTVSINLKIDDLIALLTPSINQALLALEDIVTQTTNTAISTNNFDQKAPW